MPKTKTDKKPALTIVKEEKIKAKTEKPKKKHKIAAHRDDTPVHGKAVNPVEVIQLVVVSEAPEKGLIRSEGMAKFGHPELLIPAGMPLYMAPVGASIINELADMIINGDGKPFAAGHRVQIGPFRFRLKARVYQDVMHWELSDDDMVGGCGNPHCSHKHG